MRKNNLILTVAVIAALGALTLGPDLWADPAPLAVDIVVSPSVVYMASQGTWVTVHAEISYYAVEGVTVSLDGVPVIFTKSDNRGQLVAKFTLGDVKRILKPGTMELTLSGTTWDGVAFEGSDTIRVIAPKSR